MSDISDLQGKVNVDKWLNGMYSKGISEQKSELKTLFTKIQDKALSDTQKTALTESKTSLEASIKKLEEEMATLEAAIAVKQEAIDKATEEVSELLTDINEQSYEVQQDQKKYAKQLVAEVFAKRKSDPEYGAVEMTSDMYKGMKKFAEMSGYKGLLKNIEKLEGKQSNIEALVADASKVIDSKNNLEKKYGVTKSTYDLIDANLKAVELKDANFTNSDIGVEKPIYSATKLETIVQYFDNPLINVEAGKNTNYQAGTTAPNPNLESINEKYKEFFNTERTEGVDKYSYNNAAVANLGKAIDMGLLSDLKMAGISGNNLVNFLTENFKNANIKLGDDGVLKIPYGHGSDGKANAIYKSLTSFVQSQNLSENPTEWKNGYFQGVQNTWDANKGNTLSTNNQIASLNQNFETIAKEMKDKGYTFKEAMYAMFNQENGLFKDSGIIYDVTKQTDKMNYFMEYAGDDETAGIYKNIATSIFEKWGVKPTMCTDYDNIDAEGIHEGENTPIETYRTDPLGFVDGDSEYTFIVDRDSDGKFDGKNEFLGADASKTWLEDLKSLDADGNGVLEGDELQSLQLLKSKINDNANEVKDGNAVSKTTSIGYEFTNAKDLGIEKIDLNNLADNVNKTTGRTDVNGSEVFTDSFKFTLNGKKMTAKRKDDTDEYMNAVYGNTFGARFDNLAGLTEEEIDSTIEKDYTAFDNYSAKFKDFENKVKILGGFSDTIDQTKDYVKNKETEGDTEAQAIIQKGQYEAHARYGNVTKWDSFKPQVIEAAKEKGVDVTSADFLQQAQGLYMTNSELTASQIVDRYIEMQDTVENSETRNNNSKLAFKAMVECSKEGLSAKLNDILKLIEEGKVKNENDVVNYYKAKAKADEEAQQ